MFEEISDREYSLFTDCCMLWLALICTGGRAQCKSKIYIDVVAEVRKSIRHMNKTTVLSPPLGFRTRRTRAICISVDISSNLRHLHHRALLGTLHERLRPHCAGGMRTSIHCSFSVAALVFQDIDPKTTSMEYGMQNRHTFHIEKDTVY